MSVAPGPPEPSGQQNQAAPAAAAPAGLAELYAASYQRLVATVLLSCGSREVAEECVQEAFIRLLPRWDRVSRYEDPHGWLRTVALQQATSRWRRARVALRALPRLAERDEQPPADDTRVDLEAALHNLSASTARSWSCTTRST